MLKYKEYFKDLFTESIRYDKIQSEMNRIVDDAPGSNRGEKLEWAWKNTKFGILYKALSALNDYERTVRKKYDPKNIRYYIRFADRAPEPGYRSKIWHGSTAVGTEKGISAYSAEWDSKKGMWKLNPGDNTGPEGIIWDIIREKSKLKIWLLSGTETGEAGSDTEPLLDGSDIKVVKQLSILEFYIPGYYDPDELDDDETKKFVKTPFYNNL